MKTIRFAAMVVGIALAGTALVGASTAPDGGDVAALAWMAGSWGDGKTEEHWIPPKGGAMLGVNRTVVGDRMREFEFLRIEQTADGVVYFAMPRGRAATPFKATKIERERVTFENPEHDFPKRIRYWLEDGALHARIEGTNGGRESSAEWTWRRIPGAK